MRWIPIAFALAACGHVTPMPPPAPGEPANAAPPPRDRQPPPPATDPVPILGPLR